MKRLIALVAAAGLVLTGCGDNGSGDNGSGGDGDAGGEDYPSGAVRLIAPADPGSGWDLTARAIAGDLAKEGIVTTPIPVENRPGGVGTVFFAEMVERRGGDDDILGVTSMAMNVNTTLGQTEYNLSEDVTMVAGIAAEHFLLIVSEDSEYQDLADISDAIKEDPSIPVGAATDDQFPFNLLMHESGVDVNTINYVTYEGGGDQSAALLAGDIDIAIAGFSELQPLLDGGQARGIAILAEEPVEGVDVPTAIEQGVDVEISNWRGIYGPPDMPDYAVEFWADAIEELVETDAWAETAERHQWTTQFMRGEEFDAYVQEAQETVDEGMALVGQE